MAFFLPFYFCPKFQNTIQTLSQEQVQTTIKKKNHPNGFFNLNRYRCCRQGAPLGGIKEKRRPPWPQAFGALFSSSGALFSSSGALFARSGAHDDRATAGAQVL